MRVRIRQSQFERLGQRPPIAERCKQPEGFQIQALEIDRVLVPVNCQPHMLSSQSGPPTSDDGPPSTIRDGMTRRSAQSRILHANQVHVPVHRMPQLQQHKVWLEPEAECRSIRTEEVIPSNGRKFALIKCQGLSPLSAGQIQSPGLHAPPFQRVSFKVLRKPAAKIP